MDPDVPVIGPSQPKNVNMFEADRELVLPATPSFMLNNLSVFYFEPKFTTYACYCSKNLNVTMDSLPLKESGKDKPLSVMQCRICMPSNRTLPVLVVATVLNVMVFDVKNLKILASTPVDNNDDGRESPVIPKGYKFARGISCVDNHIVIGTYTGDLLLFTCTGEVSFNVRSIVNEHKNAPIADLATCVYDLITLSADTSGHVVVWAKNMKTVMKRISTGQQISAVNILRKQAFCGNYYGQVHVYSIQSGALLAELNVHARQITAISVAPESAYIMTASEDCYVRVWKLHSRKPENYQNLLSVGGNEEISNPLTPRHPFSPLITTSSRFLFQPTDHLPPPQGGQSTIGSVVTTPGTVSLDNENNFVESENVIESQRTRIWHSIKSILNPVLKPVLVGLIMIAYACLGGLMFYYFEAEFDQKSTERNKLKILEKQSQTAQSVINLLDGRNCYNNTKRQFVSSTKNVTFEQKYQLCELQINELLDQLVRTVELQTCGYGNLACKTVIGRVSTIFYGLIGIPLFLLLLNLIGQLLFQSFEVMWKRFQRRFKRRTRRIRKRLFAVSLQGKLKCGATDCKPETCNQTQEVTEATVKVEEDEDRNIFETFPLYLALSIVFFYIFVSSVVICSWETHWTWFESFYFCFISMSTIGFYIFFVIGLALVAMCLELMRLKAENKFMTALQLIDDQQAIFADYSQQPMPTITVEDDNSPETNGINNISPQQSPSHFLSYTDLPLRLNTRWRHPSALGINNDAVIAEAAGRGNSVSEGFNPANFYVSPILSAVLNQRRTSKRLKSRGASQSSFDGGSSVHTPVGQSNADVRMSNDPSSSNDLHMSRLKPVHLWRDQHNFCASSTVSVNSTTPLTVIIENGNESRIRLSEVSTKRA
ncbi:WD repeat-containing protein 54 [Aphelenchoides besseyi]|nr:WD repeat-containing protein 54 [Aphelenchoides besseyi]